MTRLAPARVLLLAGALTLATAAGAVRYTLPDDESLDLPAGEDMELVQAHCAACHSLDYLETQPRGKDRQFWQDTVTKMVKVFGAPIEQPDADRITDYLARTYGKPQQTQKP